MIIAPTYRGYRIEINAVEADGCWNAEARIRAHAAYAKPHVRIVSCYELTPEHAERVGEIWGNGGSI